MDVTSEPRAMRGRMNYDDEIDLTELIGIVIKYRWTVLVVFVFCLAAASGYGILVTPQYKADALLHVQEPDSKLSLLAELQFDAGVQGAAETSKEILTSRAILGTVVDALRLDIVAEPVYLPLVGRGMVRIAGGELSVLEGLPWLGGYAWGDEQIGVGRLPVPDDFLNQPLLLRGTGTGFVLHDVEGQELVAGPVGETVKDAGFEVRIDELAGRPEIAFRLMRTDRNTAIESVRERLSVSGGGKRGASSDTLKLAFQDTDPKRAAAVVNLIAEDYVRYNIRRSGEEAEKTLTYIERELEKLAKDPTFNNELYFLLMTKAQELRVLKAGVVGNTHIVDRAVAPREPVQPKGTLITGVGGLLGLMAGLMLAFLRHGLDRTVHCPEDIEGKAGLEVYGIVPDSRAERKLGRASMARIFRSADTAPLLVDKAPHDLAVEGLRYLRTALQFDHRKDEGGIVVSVTGTTAGVGKTFVSSNLIYLLAESGKRVALMDADMHRGRAYEHFGVPRGPGLCDYLAGNVELDAIFHQGRFGITVIPPGEKSAQCSAVLENERLHTLMGELRRRFDMTVVDMPPLLAVADGAVIGRESDSLLMVVRAGETRLSDMSASWRRLLQAGIGSSGVILNGMEFTKRGYGQPYGGYSYVPEYLLDRPKKG